MSFFQHMNKNVVLIDDMIRDAGRVGKQYFEVGIICIIKTKLGTSGFSRWILTNWQSVRSLFFYKQEKKLSSFKNNTPTQSMFKNYQVTEKLTSLQKSNRYKQLNSRQFKATLKQCSNTIIKMKVHVTESGIQDNILLGWTNKMDLITIN